MDAEILERLIGAREDAPALEAMLSELGVQGKLRPDEDGCAIIEKPELGLALTLVPESEKSSWFKLAQVEFFSDVEEDFEIFSGALPGGLDWRDRPGTVRQKLGEPTKVNESTRMEIWIRGRYQINVRYNRSLTAISGILLCEPIVG